MQAWNSELCRGNKVWTLVIKLEYQAVFRLLRKLDYIKKGSEKSKDFVLLITYSDEIHY
jgi:hypothetical protein